MVKGFWTFLATLDELFYFKNDGAKLRFVWYYQQAKTSTITINPLSANPTKRSNTLKQLSAFPDELFECVWPYCGVGA